ncbi:MAG: molybdopterin-dependent oxidoreductase [Myxococcales bacterium]
MRHTSILGGAGLGVLTALPVLAILYLGQQWAGLPYVPFLLFEWLTRVLPGRAITAGIEAMVSVISGLGIGPTSAVAKAAEMSLAVASMLIGAVVLGIALALVGRRTGRLAIAGAVGGGLLWGITLLAMTRVGPPSAGFVRSALWLIVVLVGWGAILGYSIARTAGRGEGVPATARRHFLAGLATLAVAAFAAAVGLGRSLARRGAKTVGAEGAGVGGTGATDPLRLETRGPAASPPREALQARLEPVRGTRPELTETGRFYRIDINLTPPRIDEGAWRLRVDGLVGHPQSFTLEELRALPAVSQVVTLECISNRLGGDLISTAVFTGVRLTDLLDRVGRKPEAKTVFLESADQYFETVEPSDVEDPRTLLVWAMNGEPLPAEHGFPLRIYIPNRYGMKQPKWITHLEATAQFKPGYWVVRGWSKEAVVQTTSVIDTVGMSMMLGQATVLPIGGIAYGGARGISKVEVQVDDGPWAAAQLRTPPLSPLSWVQWLYDWPHQEGRHTFRVRAYDGAGVLQPTEMRSPHPGGATGVHELTVNV